MILRELGQNMAKIKEIPDSTLIINTWDSRCQNCGRNCDPYEKSHLRNLGYSDEIRKLPGCGIEWTHVTSFYTGRSFEERVQQMRPDLVYIDIAISPEKDKIYV